MSDWSIPDAVRHPVGMPDAGGSVKGVPGGVIGSTCRRVPRAVYAAVKTTVPAGMRTSTESDVVNAPPSRPQ